MSSRRSYLDTLNAGRQRRPQTTLDQLNHSLEILEQRLQRPPEPGSPRGGRESPEPAPVTRDDAFRTMVREVERARIQEDGVAAAGRIAGEIKGLREDFSQHDDAQRQLAASLQSEFDALRRDMERAPKPNAELNAEFERLSSAIHALAGRGDDKGVTLLRLELEQVKAAMEQLAREDSLRAVSSRWEAFEKRLGAFEARLTEGRSERDPALETLGARLEALHEAVGNLPTSHAMKGFEERLKALAGVVDQFSRAQSEFRPEMLTTVEERLDEITRAILASAVSSQQPAALDPEPFERIEARVAAIARQVEEWRAEEPADAVMLRLTHLSARIDELATKANLPAKAVEQLAAQVAIIAAKLDKVGAPADPDFVFKAIEQRFDTLSAMLERRQGDAAERAALLFRDLERRLDEVVDRLDAQPPKADPAEQDARLMGALDARFEDFARRFEARQPAGPMPAADAKLIRSLEAQLGALAEQLNRPAAADPHLKTIAPRLEGIERSLSDHQDALFRAAREAAESAVRAQAEAGAADREAVSALAQDLKSLESLARRSDERNAKTFEAIHDTLIKIVDRLGSLETAGAGPREERRTAVSQAPSLDLDDALPLDIAGPGGATGVKPERSPAEAASAAARDAADEEAGRKRSMLGGLTRALGGGRKERAAAPAPSLDLDEPLDPKAANRPLEPGSGGPDLGAIMRRVRDERAQGPRAGEGDAAKSDFIAAARRAAQAAAAEAEILKRQSDAGSQKGGSKVGDLLRRHRKSLMMAIAAIMIALAGLQGGRSYLQGSGPELAGEPAAPVVAAEAGALPDMVAPAAVAEAEAEAAPADAGDTAMNDAPMESMGEDMAALPPVSAPDPAALPTGTTNGMSAQASADLAGELQPLPPPDAPAPPSAGVPASAAMSVPDTVTPAALREAAAAGDAKALWEVGSRLADGRNGSADAAAAAKWFEAAAELGLAPAQYRVGSIYEKGLGVERDIAKAKAWYAKAAEAGNASAMHNLAVLYAMGAGGATDNEAAARWFSAAAEHGVKDSQFNLGILAAKGVGVKQDMEESYKWFALVAKTGDKDASAKRDEVANSLKPDALKRARAAAELWKAKPTDPEANAVEIPESWRDAPATTAAVDMKAAVRTIQLILNKNGYEAGGTDGVMGAKTKAAIIAFQKDNDLTPDGEVNDGLVKALLARK